MQLSPLVSVYIPTHNRSQLLLRAIKSVIAQTYNNIEIIVGDDGSTDDTYDCLLPLINKGHIKYLKNETPRGACSVRNLAINMAKGEYITGLDDDDEFTPGRVEELLSIFIDTQYSCVTASICERTPQGDIKRNFDAGRVTLDNLLHYDVLGNQVLTKTEYLRAIGGFDENMPAFQDYDTWVRLVSKFGDGLKIKSFSYVLYSDHGSTRISENSSKRIAGFKLFIEKHKGKMNKNHIKSMQLLETRLTHSAYPFTRFLVLTHRGNFIASLSYFINSNFSWLKKLVNHVRVK